MNPTRRLFLRNGIVTLAAVGTGAVEPRFLARAAAAADDGPGRPRERVLVCVFQRGAADGLSMVAPFGDPFYYRHRNEIAVPPPRPGDEDAGIDLDGQFALHPRLAALRPLYAKGQLAVLHAVGSPSASRSHFDMQDFMESGTSGDKSVVTGWASRALKAGDNTKKSAALPFRAVSMTGRLPRTLQGDNDAMAIRDLATFGVGGASLPAADNKPGSTPATGGGFESMYASAVDSTLHAAGAKSFDAANLLRRANPTQYQPANKAKYPGTALGRSLLQVAQLIKARVGVQIAFVEDEGWDTHANQGGAVGQLGSKLYDFGNALAAFHTDLGDRMADVTLLTMSEFGRAARQNGNRGTDHGHGTCFFALGGRVKGGRVLTDWPTLAPDQLFEQRDLAVTTDYRTVFAEICVRQWGLDPSKLGEVFPGFTTDPKAFRGFLAT